MGRLRSFSWPPSFILDDVRVGPCGPKLVCSSYCWIKETFHLYLLAAKVRVIGQLFDNASTTGRVNPKLASGVQSFL
jgi:hypothetical protein